MPSTWSEWASAFSLGIAVLTAAYAWVTSRAKANSEHLKTVDEKLVNHDRRIQSVESELNHLPSKDDVNSLNLAIADLRGTVGRLDESVSGVSRSMRRVEGYLLKEGN